MGKIKEEKTRQDRKRRRLIRSLAAVLICLLYTSDAADE